MRDVTDNVTGELDVTTKRGRGRPRKEGALTNAQRQAAFRARRRADSVTVTKKVIAPVQDVDAYDECRFEVETLRAELADARETISGLSVGIENKHRAMLRAERERDEALAAAKKGGVKSVTGRGNGIGLYAEIKKSSKYYGQTAPGELFAVRSLEKGEYAVQGGPGGQYRLRDVWLWSNGVRIG